MKTVQFYKELQVCQGNGKMFKMFGGAADSTCAKT